MPEITNYIDFVNIFHKYKKELFICKLNNTLPSHCLEDALVNYIYNKTDDDFESLLYKVGAPDNTIYEIEKAKQYYNKNEIREYVRTKSLYWNFGFSKRETNLVLDNWFINLFKKELLPYYNDTEHFDSILENIVLALNSKNPIDTLYEKFKNFSEISSNQHVFEKIYENVIRYSDVMFQQRNPYFLCIEGSQAFKLESPHEMLKAMPEMIKASIPKAYLLDSRVGNNYDPKYYIFLGQEGHHSFVALGLESTKAFSMRYGKVLHIAKKQWDFNPENLTVFNRPKEIHYVAYSLTEEQKNKFLSLKNFLFDHKAESKYEIENIIKKSAYTGNFFNNTCRSTVLKILKYILGRDDVGVSKHWFVKPSFKMTSFQELYVLPELPPKIPAKTAFHYEIIRAKILQIMFKRLQDIIKKNPELAVTRTKYDALRKMYELMADNQIKNFNLNLSAKTSELYAMRNQGFFSKFFGCKSSTEKMFSALKHDIVEISQLSVAP